MLKFYIFCILISCGLTLAANDTCARSNTDCRTCVHIGSQCGYCKNSKECFAYDPLHLPCSSSDLQIGTCFGNAQILAIVFGSIGGVVVIVVIVLICCCCKKCRERALQKLRKKDIVYENRLEQRRAAAEMRSADRNEKNDAIRMKYGLLKENETANDFRRMS